MSKEMKNAQKAYEDAIRADERVKSGARMYALLGSLNGKENDMSHREFFELLVEAAESSK